MKSLQGMAKPFVVFVERYYPDPFVFAILLTFLTLLLALLLTDASPSAAILSWGDGLPMLLAFTCQVCLTLVAAHALAHTDPMQRLLYRISAIPKTPVQAYALVAAASGMFSLVAWSLGLVAGAILAREVGIGTKKRGLKIHYPLLVASAYAGFVVWHMGYSGSATLAVATPGNNVESLVGLIPVSQTMLTWQNILLASLTVLAIAVVCPLMRPRDNEILEADLSALEQAATEQSSLEEANSAAPASQGTQSLEGGRTLAQILDGSRLLSLSIGGLLAAYLLMWFVRNGRFDLNLNVVIFTFVALGLLMARSPLHYVNLIVNAGSTVGLLLLQYPLYAGILGLMQGTGLATLISNFFTSIATADTLPFFAFLAGGLVNMFIPSGGGQWAVQGPIFLESALQLGADPATVVLGVAYGDQWTNAIQPFWTIPVLAIAGLHMRQIMGYTFIIFLLTFLIFGGGLLLLF